MITDMIENQHWKVTQKQWYEFAHYLNPTVHADPTNTVLAWKRRKLIILKENDKNTH